MNSILSSPLIMKMMADNLDRFAREKDPTGTPLYNTVMNHLGADRTVIDIGAGVGRFAIPMARAGLKVAAVEPSDEMCKRLFDSIEKEDLKSRIDVIQSEWPVKEDLHADVTFASLVIQFSNEPLKFIRAMEKSAKNRCILSVHVDQPLPFLKDIWPIFRPADTVPSMLTFSDLYPLMLNEGIIADVTIITENRPPLPMKEPYRFVPMLSELLMINDKPSEMQRLSGILIAKRKQVQQMNMIRTALISWHPTDSKLMVR
ncbi:MAG: class I SAM-dependent methyltransferase [Candidatus Parvarchaeota archaeon]